MRLLWIIALTAMAAIIVNAAGLAGTWKGSMETQMGPTDVEVTFQPGAAVAGRVKAGEFDAAIENGKLDGGKIHFEINIEHGRVIYDGTVAGDEMKLNVTGTQGTKYSLICKRQK